MAQNAKPKYSNVAYVILGFLAKSEEPLSGYDIKQWVDNSVRFFFAASFGQIYPELKKLENAGLIEGVANATGGRARTEYTISKAGHDELRAWLMQSETRLEMRDQGILRVFFSGDLGKAERLAKLKELRAARVESYETLQAVHAMTRETISQMPELVLDYGLGLHQYVIDWCDRAIKAVEDQ
ncbi:MAG: PadR family transcriptional regulator [Thermoleophilaceae bacterium]|nr:PadR family transcriptional regulator [Thermoleophilaceae bacterium]